VQFKDDLYAILAVKYKLIKTAKPAGDEGRLGKDRGYVQNVFARPTYLLVLSCYLFIWNLRDSFLSLLMNLRH